jgi:FkbM family methyltransferase
MKPKLQLRKFLCRLGYDLHRLPIASLTFRDLEFDLPALIKNANPVVIDIGANEGQTIDMVRRAFATPTIFSFEPNPELLPLLKQKYGSSGIVIEGLALGNSEESAPFHLSENSELSSVLTLDQSNENPFSKVSIRDTVRVPMTKLDTYVEKSGLPYIDLLKIDTQGFDLEVLRGASRSLDRRAVGTLLVEVNFISLYKSQGTFGEIQQFLKERGYGLVALYEIVRTNFHISWSTACFQRAG